MDYNYKIDYLKRKSISISVKNGEVIIKAPRETSRKRIEELIFKHQAWIKKRIDDDSQKRIMMEQFTRERIKQLKRDARLYFNEVIEEYSQKMGLRYSNIKITSAQKRFGSCSSKGNICFSFWLMLYPKESREYVVVHELAHLKEMNHSKRFYKIIEGVLPDWKERKKMLKSLNYNDIE